MTTTAANVWMDTYQRDKIAGLPGVTLLSAVNEHDNGKRWLCAEMGIDQSDPESPLRMVTEVRMTPAQMRALATALQTHADRVEQVLMPLLQPEPQIIPFELHREAETA